MKQRLFSWSILGGLLLSATLAMAAPSDITWTDDVSINPVILNQTLGDKRAYYGCVIYDKTAQKWRAWYDASSGKDLGYAESTDVDGKTWTNYQLCKGFSSSQQSKAFVVQTGPSQFRMWYTADQRQGGYYISSCVSSDGVNWTQDDWVTGIAEPDPLQYGPTERIAVFRLDNGSFVAYVRCEEPEIAAVADFLGTKRLYRYTSSDGKAWTWAGDTGVSSIEGMDGIKFSSVVKHHDKDGVWYAWGCGANSSGPIQSFVSTDDGLTFQLDENPVFGVGEIGTQTYNVDRNYHPSVTYMGQGRWIMYRTVAEPKATARAEGTEPLETPVSAWSLF